MKDTKARQIIEEINDEYDLDLTIYDVLDEANVTEEELRAMALRAGGIEPEEKAEEKPPLELGGKTPKELERQGVDLYDLAAKQIRDEAAEKRRVGQLSPISISMQRRRAPK